MSSFMGMPSFAKVEHRRVRALDVGDAASLVSDIISLIVTIDGWVTDFICFTNPGVALDLWKEASGVIASLTGLVTPIVSELRVLSLSNFGGTAGGVKNPKPPGRYMQPEEVTFAGLISTINEYLPKVQRRLMMWKRAIPAIESQEWYATKLSVRPVPEILMEALLWSCKPTLSNQPAADQQAIHNWFAWLPHYGSSQPLTNPMNVNESRLSKASDQTKHNWNPDSSIAKVGTVNCVCAIYMREQKSLHTGSTLVKWGEILGNFQVVGEDLSLHNWFRVQRQKRFRGRQQGVVTALVQQVLRALESEITRQAAIIAAENPRAKKTFREKTSKEQALKYLIFNYSKNLPPTLKKYTKLQIMGQSWDGQTFEVKPKCPICECIYPFPLARPREAIKLPVRYYETTSIGECDPKKVGGRRGCCAEAPAIISSIRALGRDFENLCEELGVTP